MKRKEWVKKEAAVKTKRRRDEGRNGEQVEASLEEGRPRRRPQDQDRSLLRQVWRLPAPRSCQGRARPTPLVR